MNRGIRIVLWILAVCAVLVVLAYVGLNWYLSTESARNMATEELSKALGGRVTVQSIDAGLGSTTVDIVIPAEASTEPGAPASGADIDPVLVGTVRANVSPVGLAAGRSPDQITVENARVHLRFDENGDMLTQLPTPPKSDTPSGPIPAVDINAATVTVEQTGRPAFTVSGVDLTIRETDGRLTLAGAAADDQWGRWNLAGDVAADGSTGTITIESPEPVPVTMPMLESIPFVPAETWKEVQLEGKVTGKLVLTMNGDDLGYTVELKPRDAKLTIPTVGLTVTDAAATIGVDGEKVTLSNFTGAAADGRLTVDGAFNYAATPSDLALTVKAEGLTVTKLPKEWSLPPTLLGKINGDANVNLTFAADGLQTSGSGKGTVADAKWNDIPIESLELKLVSDENGFHFEAEQPVIAAREPGDESVSQPREQPESRPDPVPEGWIPFLLTLAVGYLADEDEPDPAAGTPEKAAGPTYFEANLKLKDVDLGDLITKLKLELPIRVGGKLSVSVKAGIPVNDSDNLQKYRIDGTVTMPQLTIQDLTLNDVTATARLRDGVLTLTELSGTVPGPMGANTPGTFNGQAEYGIEPKTNLTAALKIDSLPVGEILKVMPDLAGLIVGPATGSLDLTIPAEKLDDVTAINATATLTSPAMIAVGRHLTDIKLKLAVKDGTARLTEGYATVEGLPLAGAGVVALKAPFQYEAAVNSAETDLESLQALVPEATLPFPVSGKITTKVRATGTASPFTVSATGSAAASSLVLGTAKVSTLAFNWAATTDDMTISDLKAEVYEGTIVGSASVPFADTKAGKFAFDITDVDADKVTRNVPSLPIKLVGDFSGTVRGQLPAVKPGGTRDVDVALDLTAPKMRVQGLPTERLRGQVEYAPGALTYSLTGDALTGSFEVEGTYPLDGKAKPAAAPAADADGEGGTVSIRNFDLSRLSAALNVAALRPLRGRLELAARYKFDPETSQPVGSGTIRLIGFGWGTGRTSDLTGEIKSTANTIELNDVSGRLADGMFRGQAKYNLVNPGRSYFLFSLDRADAAKLLEPLDIDDVDGQLSLSMRGHIGQEIRGSGTLAGSRVTIASAKLGEARVPFNWAFIPGRGGELTIRGGYATVGRGRVNGQLSARWSRTASVKGNLRFIDIDIATLLGSIGQGSRANGRFDFAGRDVQAVKDLSGTLSGKFSGSGGFIQLPLFKALTPYINGFSSFSQAKDGEIRGRLGKGLFRIEKFTLSSTNAAIYADGTVGVSNGRLDMDVVAQTGQIGPSPTIVRLIRFIPVAGPIPLGVLIDINDILSNRIVRLKVVGTTHRPVVRVNTANFLAENAARYFLNKYSPVPIPTPTPGAP